VAACLEFDSLPPCFGACVPLATVRHVLASNLHWRASPDLFSWVPSSKHQRTQFRFQTRGDDIRSMSVCRNGASPIGEGESPPVPGDCLAVSATSSMRSLHSPVRIGPQILESGLDRHTDWRNLNENCSLEFSFSASFTSIAKASADARPIIRIPVARGGNFNSSMFSSVIENQSLFG
jgi:hypothetical protein